MQALEVARRQAFESCERAMRGKMQSEELPAMSRDVDSKAELCSTLVLAMIRVEKW